MLSRFSLCGGQSLRKCVIKFQPAYAVTTSASTPAADVAPKKDNYPPEYPPAGPKRDHVNFPRLSMRERPPPYRMAFIPDSWFQFFYPKTGYTGPYIFLITTLGYMYSKEILVHDHNMVHLHSLMFLFWFVHTRYGDKLRVYYDKLLNEYIERLDGGQEAEKKFLREEIERLEKAKTMKDAIIEISKAKTEIVHLQMEASYRQRMMEAYKMVKDKLDCQVELENVERRAAQRNVYDFVMSSVMKSITPDLQKNVLQTCINDLNALAAKA